MSRSKSTSVIGGKNGVGTDRERVPVAGGTLVYESRDVGRELVGFEDVESWSDLADAVAARGHDRGDALHLPELDGGQR